MKKAVLFDLDGTLIDSSEGITKAVQYALGRFGIEENDLQKLHPFIGPPLTGSFMKYYGLSEEQAKQGVVYYREYYRPTGIYQCSLYPGVKECLSELKKQGYLIGLASSKPENFCRRILEFTGIQEWFDEVTGATQDGRITTKEEVLQEAFRRWDDLRKEEICLIGDTIFDIEGARLAGIQAIAVTYGFGNTDDMIQAGADGICNRLQDLPDRITELR